MSERGREEGRGEEGRGGERRGEEARGGERRGEEGRGGRESESQSDALDAAVWSLMPDPHSFCPAPALPWPGEAADPAS